jgi:hypothetical protein
MDLNTHSKAAMAETRKDGREMVFDWEKAARVIVERRATAAAAYLGNDYRATWRPILSEGRPADTEFIWLASAWGIPTLEINGETAVPCWRWTDETSWDGSTYWPAAALAILRAGAPEDRG